MMRPIGEYIRYVFQMKHFLNALSAVNNYAIFFSQLTKKIGERVNAVGNRCMAVTVLLYCD